MKNIYFNIDVFKREVYFFSVSSPTKRELIHTYTFDDMMYMAEDYATGGYQKKLQGLYDLMMEQIENKEDEQVQALTRQLDNEFKENIFASVCLSILYGTYQNQKDTLNHLGIIGSLMDSVSQKFTLQVKGNIESKFSEITNSMNNFIDCVNNDFRHTPETTFKSDGKYILEFNKRDGNMLYSVNEFIEPLTHIFLTNLYIGNLKVFTCKHCGKKYFDNTDKGYCPKEICQQAEEEKPIHTKTYWTISVYTFVSRNINSHKKIFRQMLLHSSMMKKILVTTKSRWKFRFIKIRESRLMMNWKAT